MGMEKNSSFDIEKELSDAVNVGEGFDIYEILNSKFIEDKNKINYGSKIGLSFLEKFFNPEIGLGLRLNSKEIKSKKIKKSFYFVGRKNASNKYNNPILFQDKSLLGEKNLEIRDFYMGGNVYGCFFNTGFYFKKISVTDNEMAGSINSLIDSCSCSFSKNQKKDNVEATVLDLSKKVCNLNNLFNYETPLGFLMEKIIHKKIEKVLFNCPKKMYDKILKNFLEILKGRESIKENIEFVEREKNGVFNIKDIEDIFLEYKERRYFLARTLNVFFIVKGKDNRIFLLDFFKKKDFKFSKVLAIINSYSEMAKTNEKLVTAFSAEIFLNEK
jgi:hypothetical protein